MKIKQLWMALVLAAFLPALAHAVPIPHYNAATIFTANSTVTLVPSTNGSGELNGIKCIFPSTASGASVKVIFTIDGAASSNIIIDPTNLERESSGAGQFTSEWIPVDLEFFTSIQVQLNNTGLGTASINCWASWYD
jgi:hypothetical protein